MSKGMDYEDNVVWEEGQNDAITCFWYISFASLRHTACMVELDIQRCFVFDTFR
ncbi:hypothetical protein HanRHA438_Chr02g0054231 [Helianthus annuus]|nr:hypothetical protein HanRHA438_Chr02g0054231 [Helianthus annuus]